MPTCLPCGTEFVGRKVAFSGELLTPTSLVQAFSQVFPQQKFRFENPDLSSFAEQTKKAGFGDALANMYGFYVKRMPRGGDLELTKQLNPNVKSLAQYLKDYKSDFKFE